jgi:hypothetical protein
MPDQLTQWARSLFPNISNPASAGNISTAARMDVPLSYEAKLALLVGAVEAEIREAQPAGTQAPPVDTSPAPDFRYRPVTTSVRRRG